MPTTLKHLFFSLLIYLIVCTGSFVFISPYSFISFIGSAAGITTALVILWGTSVLISIVIATVIFLTVLHVYFQVDFSLAMVIITLLSIMLQSYWAKHLVLSVINQQRWLKSRKHLLQFLFRIGPLSAIVCASAVIIISMLDNKTFSGHLFYTSVSTWSASILFAIFFTPTLLLSYGQQQQLSTSKRFFIIIASLLAMIAIGLLFKISQNFQQHNRLDIFEKVKENITQTIAQEIKITTDGLTSISALMQTRNNISQADFEHFSQIIIHDNSSIKALEWAPIVSHHIRVEYEEKSGDIVEYNPKGYMESAAIRERYAPIQLVFPLVGNELILGFDVLNNPKHVISMASVMASNEIIASAPINLIQEKALTPGILFIAAVFSSDNKVNAELTALSHEKGQLLGFVIAAVQFERFFQQIAPSITDNIALFIEEISTDIPYILFGSQLEQSNRRVDTLVLEVYSRQWRISLGELQPWHMQEKNWQTWGMLLGATLGGILFQVLILIMAAYSSELSAQVVRKTRELILATEQSEQKNLAKTNFLNTLNKELQTPLQAIANFTRQLNESSSVAKQEVVKNIELAQQNMSKLLDIVLDLSKIEAGNLGLKQETFDFHGFLTRIDAMFKVKLLNESNSIAFLVDKSAPHFINSDELRIQQILVALCDDVHHIFGVNNMRLSIKARNHRLNSATLLFVFTHHDDEISAIKAPFSTYIEEDIALFSTQMAVVKEVCQFMDGDISVAVSKSGGRVLTASIKVMVTSVEQKQVFQAQVFDGNYENSR